MSDLTVHFKNLGAAISSLQKLDAGVDQAFAAELYASAEEVMTRAKELTPVDTGNLRASGHVQQPKVEAGIVTLELGFGGPAGAGNVGDSNSQEVGYALYVHEDLNVNHPVGQAKYLETPLME